MSHPKYKFTTPYPTEHEFELARRFDAHMANQPTGSSSFGAAVLLASALMFAITFASLATGPSPAPAPEVQGEQLMSSWTGTVEVRRGK